MVSKWTKGTSSQTQWKNTSATRVGHRSKLSSQTIMKTQKPAKLSTTSTQVSTTSTKIPTINTFPTIWRWTNHWRTSLKTSVWFVGTMIMKNKTKSSIVMVATSAFTSSAMAYPPRPWKWSQSIMILRVGAARPSKTQSTPWLSNATCATGKVVLWFRQIWRSLTMRTWIRKVKIIRIQSRFRLFWGSILRNKHISKS